MSTLRRLSEIAVPLRGLGLLAAGVGLTSLALAAVEGASVTLILPFLKSFGPGSAPALRWLIGALALALGVRALMIYLNSLLSARLQVRALLRLRTAVMRA